MLLFPLDMMVNSVCQHLMWKEGCHYQLGNIKRGFLIGSMRSWSDVIFRLILSWNNSLGKINHTEMRFNLCTWLGEISSCSCLTVLPGPAWVMGGNSI